MNKDEYEKSVAKLSQLRNIQIRTVQRRFMSINDKRKTIHNINKWYFSEVEKMRIRKEESKCIEKIDKYALLIGINYRDTNYELRGCVNDVYLLKHILINKYEYVDENIVCLLDTDASKESIIRHLKGLFNKSKEGDKLFFSFSGHGLQNDVILASNKCTIQCEEIKKILDDNMKNRVQLFMFFDNCHSGFFFQMENDDTQRHIICLSGCEKDQKSLDVCINGKYHGAITYYAMKILENNNLTWKMFYENLLHRVKVQRLTQKPILKCPENIFEYTLDI